MLTTTTKYGLFAFSALVFAGCSANQPSAPVYDENGICTAIPSEKQYINEGGYATVEKHTVYTPDVDLKPAVVILMRKVDSLEQRIAKLEKNPASFKPKVKYTSCGPAVPVRKKYKKYHDGRYISLRIVPIWSCATKRGEKKGHLPKGTEVRLIDCGIYGWCKLADQKGYVEAYKLKRVGD